MTFDHTDSCDRCQGLIENLTEIERVLSETKFPLDDEKDEAVPVPSSPEKVTSWDQVSNTGHG